MKTKYGIWCLMSLMLCATEGIPAALDRFDAPTNRITDSILVLFQSGYLTLKSYEPDTETFTLAPENINMHLYK